MGTPKYSHIKMLHNIFIAKKYRVEHSQNN